MPPAGEGNSAALPQQVSGTISRRRPTESYFNKLKAEKNYQARLDIIDRFKGYCIR